jgi:hypothetical protein
MFAPTSEVLAETYVEHIEQKYIFWYVSPLLGNELLEDLPRIRIRGKESVAKLRKSGTVLCNPFLCDVSVNRFPRRRNDVPLQKC